MLDSLGDVGGLNVSVAPQFSARVPAVPCLCIGLVRLGTSPTILYSSANHAHIDVNKAAVQMLSASVAVAWYRSSQDAP